MFISWVLRFLYLLHYFVLVDAVRFTFVVVVELWLACGKGDTATHFIPNILTSKN